jgi:hypothetical protein
MAVVGIDNASVASIPYLHRTVTTSGGNEQAIRGGVKVTPASRKVSCDMSTERVPISIGTRPGRAIRPSYVS